MKRSKHTLSHYKLLSGNMGQLLPIACVPVLPGDTVQHHTTALTRLSPLNTPVMHPTQVRIHHFYVPNRIVWDGWEEFITGGPDGMDASEIPTFTTTATEKRVTNYLGVPPIEGVEVSELPLRAFNMIYNEYYRDQDVTPERPLGQNDIPRCAWEKDYFTTSRPWTQKGPDVSIPIGQSAPVIGDMSDLPDSNKIPFLEASQGKENFLAGYTGKTVDAIDDIANPGTIHWGQNTGLIADLANAQAVNVNDFRAAFSIQRYQEARARYGSRFTEYLRYLGIRPSDARLQRPEYLGGGQSRVSFSEVLQTAPSDATGGPEEATGIGDMFGHGIAGVRSNRYRKFFEEHGYIISILSVRPKAIYVNGIPREWLKTTKEDFFQKELANLGQQEVYSAEIYAQDKTNILGYQDRYHEYRYHPSNVAGDFRDTLNAWHMGRDLSPGTTLNNSFIICDPDRRIFQVTDEDVDTLWIMVNNHMVARRIVPKRANPRIL